MNRTLKTTALSLILLAQIIACQTEKQVSESDANNKLLLGLAVGSALSTSFLLDYNGQWNAGYTYNSSGQLTGTPTGRLIIATNADGSGSIISGFDTTPTYGAGGGDTTYRILSFDKATRRLYYQNTPGNNNWTKSSFGRIDYTPVTTSGCELGAAKCFYFCELISGKATLAEVQASTVTSNPTNYATNGCGGYTFSRALSRTENSTWTGL
ncbi:hypothetical protein ND861_00615 [Leptospira sp. 2 VSF19]|uniref:Lipoprotein n=1 Tax=Leptospira soteropolitanensis TaxID=2950025 RepID=A0AAW5V6X7_9LEPT|nr:hypothetical protein [Leptospira soteropolitanensis]MCW7491144.1 hypothetical protein [Leptospira soteropolitanensis]MCW7498728.1 hypothetical protein [Leptospira soteropolitanensis]MCW7521679.1 hypothetical protein [Leptospira soteropolitanensis]MCW7524832.1 hypothetical protein [Leptospira soteropolitanensis]MCW7528699.1 hypothetical protein [Leptospira soteropolitanensis]